jgi:PAS domain S-box-containing protein
MNTLIDNFEMRESETLYRALVRSLPAIVYLTKPEAPFTMVFINDYLKTLGYTQTDWHKQPDFWLSIIHPGDKDYFLQATEAVGSEMGGHNLEYRIYNKSGKIIWVKEDCQYIFSENGAPLYRQGVVIDITAKKIAELEQQELASKLQSAQAEIKTLSRLLPICGYCSKVRNDKNYWQEVEKYLSEQLPYRFGKSICPECLLNIKCRLNGITQRLQGGCDHAPVSTNL